ncbi:hypothetical protein MCOR19_009269 [Pyricularia oryzae]|uniref:Uncharacterized protein n=1 Tax=Pyricularia oryzae TaxID=318829 RepID=A0A4V1C4P0_PYROR|nr:hypothetical protein MCOR19_009269 [Pyricularia oryzae]KAI6459699.1 hypothetical protein MCOR17_006900 [Pyricularia oryzae]QBZ53555.1 hypothetical protein PoMZ_09243 [Pyricularia oryzae]
MMLDHPSLSVLNAYPDHEPGFVNEETNACQRPPDDNATFLHVLLRGMVHSWTVSDTIHYGRADILLELLHKCPVELSDEELGHVEDSPTKCDDEKVAAITLPFGRRQWQSPVYRWRFLDVWEPKMYSINSVYLSMTLYI